MSRMTYAQQVLAQEVAQGVILEIASRASGGPDVLDYYQAHRDGRCDFVYVEEAVSSGLAHRIEDAAEVDGLHEFACGVVFGWLRAAHGVQPPSWFKNWLDGYDGASGGEGPTGAQREAFIARHDPERREPSAVPAAGVPDAYVPGRPDDETIEACPGCGCMPGDGRTAGCTHPDGCGYLL